MEGRLSASDQSLNAPIGENGEGEDVTVKTRILVVENQLELQELE